jgi:hypothetical protein
VDQPDVRHIARIRAQLDQLSTAAALSAIAPAIRDAELEHRGIRWCTLDHVATLVFPRTLAEVAAELREHGFAVEPPVPSIVVKSRLSLRYQLEPDEFDVGIMRGAVLTERFGRREIEVFVVMGAPERVADEERRALNEAHVAFLAHMPEEVLADLHRGLCESSELLADGGGYNQFEKPHEGGRSVLYFRARRRPVDLSLPHRLELTCPGEHADVIAQHLRASAAMAGAGRSFLPSTVTSSRA